METERKVEIEKFLWSKGTILRDYINAPNGGSDRSRYTCIYVRCSCLDSDILTPGSRHEYSSQHTIERMIGIGSNPQRQRHTPEG